MEFPPRPSAPAGAADRRGRPPGPSARWGGAHPSAPAGAADRGPGPGPGGRWLLGLRPGPRASNAGGAGFCCSVSVLCGAVPRRNVSSARRVRAIAAVLGGRALVLRGHSAVSVSPQDEASPPSTTAKYGTRRAEETPLPGTATPPRHDRVSPQQPHPRPGTPQPRRRLRRGVWGGAPAPPTRTATPGGSRGAAPRQPPATPGGSHKAEPQHHRPAPPPPAGA